MAKVLVGTEDEVGDWRRAEEGYRQSTGSSRRGVWEGRCAWSRRTSSSSRPGNDAQSRADSPPPPWRFRCGNCRKETWADEIRLTSKNVRLTEERYKEEGY